MEWGGGVNYQLNTEIDTGDTWIDGKKIYLWIAKATSPSATNTVTTIYAVPQYFTNNNCQVISLDGFFMYKSGSNNHDNIISINNTRSDNYCGTIFGSDSGVRMMINNSGMASKPVVLYIKYIKN